MSLVRLRCALLPRRRRCADAPLLTGVPRDASPEAIKRAYKLLALRHHPDKAGDDAAAVGVFQRVSFAYGVLYDARKRRYYDETGAPLACAPSFDSSPLASGDTEEVDVSAVDFMATFKATMDEMLGGLTVQARLHSLRVCRPCVVGCSRRVSLSPATAGHAGRDVGC